MKLTYRLTGIFVLVLATAVAGMSAAGVHDAAAAGPNDSIRMRTIDPTPTPTPTINDFAAKDDGTATLGGGWFPLPPELTVFCGLLFECKPCGWAPECQYPGRDAMQLVAREGAEPGYTPWFPIPPELTSLCGTLLECKPCGWAPECQAVAEPGFVSRDPETGVARIVVKVCGSTVDNGFPGCVLAILK